VCILQSVLVVLAWSARNGHGLAACQTAEIASPRSGIGIAMARVLLIRQGALELNGYLMVLGGIELRLGHVASLEDPRKAKSITRH